MSAPAVNSPVKRDAPLASPLSARYYPASVAIPGTLHPVAATSIQTGASAYFIQTPLTSTLAIASNFPAT